jgi:flagellar protein FlgJ
MTRQDYFSKYYRTAVIANSGTVISPRLSLAVAALESGNGNSELARIYNNHFGIKVDSRTPWKGKKIYLYTKESGGVKSGYYWFRVYGSPQESYRDFIFFLQDNPRYRSAGLFATKNPALQANALQTAGYATASNYGSMVINVMNQIPATITAGRPIIWQTWAAGLAILLIKRQ